MIDFFSNYSDVKKILKNVKDPGTIKHLTDTLKYMREQMFKSDEYLDSILEKQIDEITPQYLCDILCKLGDPDNDSTW